MRWTARRGCGRLAMRRMPDSTRTDSEDAPIDQRNNLYLLEQLRGAIAQPWTARYRCALAVARDGVTLLTADGSVEGQIIAEPRGTGGFGYDPLFWLPELGKTMAEIDLETKQRLSHRGRALQALLEQMRERTIVINAVACSAPC